MRKRNPSSRESGIALLLAIFTLLLLAAMGMALLCAADLETTIAANYRDKQITIYGAMSGLQEARDRLIPALCDPKTDATCQDAGINTDTLQAPNLTNGGVIYVINPRDASDTVAPWSTANAYFDSELCHENIAAFGLTKTAGVCPPTANSIPAGSNWYQVRSNLDSATAKSYFANTTAYPKPLSFKWVRISLKTDNMTPALAMGGGAGGTGYGTVMCWDPAQGQVPATSGPGYDSTCSTTRGIVLFNGANVCTTCTYTPPMGTGYVNPVVTITGGGGSGASAVAHVVQTPNGQVNAVNLTNNGTGYTTAPAVIIDPPPIGGTQATATATIVKAGSPVSGFSSVTQTNPIGCYSTTPSVTITGGGGSGAAATAVMSGNTCIAGWTIGLNGNCTSGGTETLTAVGGGGSGFQATVEIKSNGKSILSNPPPTIINPGSGYTSAPTGVSGGTHGCDYSVTWILGKQVQSIQLANGNTGGSGYSTQPSVSIAAPTMPSGSASPTVTANLGAAATNAGEVVAVTITNQGSGYSSVPNVAFSGGGGTNAAGTAVIGTTGQIDTITLTNAGSGYTSNPTVTITDAGGGTGATIEAHAGNQTQLGRVYLLTAMAVGPNGSKTVTQMEVATAITTPFPSTMPAALTLDAFSVHMDPGSSNNYKIIGNDAHSGGATAQPPKPSVGVIDNPNSPTSPASVSCITSVLGGAPNPACPSAGGVKKDNYYGQGASPDVKNVYGSLGALTTPAGADALATAITEKANANNIFGTNPSNITANMSYPNTCPTIVVNGDLNLGPGTYCGVLLVTGNLTMQGNYTWYGPVFVIGQGGTFTGGGGGNGQIVGTLFIAQTKNPDGSQRSTLGTPTVSFQLLGGGGNGIQYDSNWSDRLIANLNLQPVKSSSPLKVLSVRNIY